MKKKSLVTMCILALCFNFFASASVQCDTVELSTDDAQLKAFNESGFGGRITTQPKELESELEKWNKLYKEEQERKEVGCSEQ